MCSPDAHGHRRRYGMPVLQGFEGVHIDMNWFKGAWPVEWEFKLGLFDMRSCSPWLGSAKADTEHLERMPAANCRHDKPEVGGNISVFFLWPRSLTAVTSALV